MKYEEFYERLKTVAQANLKKYKMRCLTIVFVVSTPRQLLCSRTLTFVYLTICLPIEPPISWLK